MGDLTGVDRLDIVCDNCGIEESRHTGGGGTLVVNKNGSYLCDRYSQKKLQTRKEWLRDNKLTETTNAESNQQIEVLPMGT